MKDTNCTKCGSDSTQSFKMANRAGTTSGIGVGVGATGDGDTGLGVGLTRSKTGIAKLTAPPTKDGGAGESIALILIALFIFNIVSIIAVWLISLVSGAEFESVSVWIAGLFVGLIATLVFGITMWKWTNANKAKRDAAFKAATMKWEHTWLCIKCGNAFYVR